jgi:hypothetical protein
MIDKLKSWKLKHRHGIIKTPFTHFSLIAEGIVEDELQHGFECPQGNAFMGMKVWAASDEEAINMIKTIGEQIGFITTKRVYIYSTEPAEPPGENPHGYDINFTPFKDDN